MAQNFIIDVEVAKDMADAFTTALDAGSGAIIEIYTAGGGVPADTSVAISDQTKLATLAMSSTSFGAAADDTPGALITANSIADDSSADATGTAAFFRMLTQSGGTTIAQGTVGTSDADLVVNTTSFTSGSQVSITSFTILMPESA